MVKIATWQNVMVDTDLMEPGKFYLIHVNKDNATAVVEVSSGSTKKQEFTDTRYIEVDYSASIPPDVEIYETIYDEGGVLKCNLTEMKRSIREEGDNKKIILESNKNITGFLIIRS